MSYTSIQHELRNWPWLHNFEAEVLHQAMHEMHLPSRTAPRLSDHTSTPPSDKSSHSQLTNHQVQHFCVNVLHGMFMGVDFVAS
jgi:hypothetical protein